MTPALAELLGRALSVDDAAVDATHERILDAALAEVSAFGARLTMEDVAARAAVGRMTVFRRFGSKQALLDALLARELNRFLEGVSAALEGLPDPAERVAEAFVACVRSSREHPLISRAVRTDPGAALSDLLRGDPSAVDLGREFVAGYLRAEAGLAGDPEETADVLVRLALTYVLHPGPVAALRHDEELRAFARRVIAPIVG